MRCDPYERPVCKLWVCGNHTPRLKSVGEAIKRRMNRIPFNVIIPLEERDTKLVDKLEAEWPAILRKMIDGCLEWRQVGLKPPNIVTDATKEYLDGEDLVLRWFEDRCIFDANAWTQSSVLHRSFQHWAASTGERVINL
jgi:putative DNA primase/helicase